MNKKNVAKLSLLALFCLTISMNMFGCQKDDHTKSPQKDIVDTAVAAGDFSTLVAAVKAADLVGTLKSPGPFTVFAPTDEAFNELPPGSLLRF